MKFVLEFGIRGGFHNQGVVIPTGKLASLLASGFVYTSGGAYEIGSVASDWNMLKGIYRKTWQSKTHFVAVSKLDGVMRGPASTNLWKLDSKVEGFLEYHYG